MQATELIFSPSRFWRRLASKDRKRSVQADDLWRGFKRDSRRHATRKERVEAGKDPLDPPPPPKQEPHRCYRPGEHYNVAEVGYCPDDEACEEPFVEPTEGMAIRRAYKLLDKLRAISNNRTARCRRFRLHKTVQVFCDGDVAWVTGVQSCNNCWGCPVCATIIQSRRAAEIDSAIDQWIRYGPERKGPPAARAYMLTLTIRHAISHALKETSQLVADAWSEMFAGRRGQELRTLLGMRHFVRALEPTYGEHGWHPHLHCILLTDRELTREQEQLIRERWHECLDICAPQSAKFQPNEKHGINLRELYQSRDGRYVAKMFLELQSYASKEALNGNLTYWQVAKRAAAGERKFVHIWEDAQHALFGRKQLTWSKGTKGHFGIPDLTDEDINNEDGIKVRDASKLFQLDIPGQVWDQAWRNDRRFLSTLLGLMSEAVRTGNYAKVIRLASAKLARQGGGKPCGAPLTLARVVPAALTHSSSSAHPNATAMSLSIAATSI